MHAIPRPIAIGLVLVTMALAACSTNLGNSGNGTNDKLGSDATTPDAAAVDGSSDSSDQPDAQAQVCPGATVLRCPSRIPSFSRDVTSIVQSRCSGCHSPFNDAGLWPLNDQQSLSDWQISILQVLRACSQPPPASGVALTLSERQAIEAWLVCGAPDN